MKKLLIVSLFAALVAQAPLLYSETQFNFVNRLHPDSQFKHTCESAYRAIFYGKWALEDACDVWDNEFKRAAELGKALALCEHKKDRDALNAKFNQESYKNADRLRKAMDLVLADKSIEVKAQEELFIKELADQVFEEAECSAKLIR